ncbi:hypothetical protein NHX12_006313 [Muraenolepis orangiensis]|uniref:Major intrinsically disordered Notch2-binding receptor 1-like C-terminal domain-containing protein n=1 Tax=Muraenolepis orangiensis TaxID=630683 RepID=A0A9Q0IEG6_9TELE|nr:hypothetical protein NHX12_006313 [Muraenolepis orangiensis]
MDPLPEYSIFLVRILDELDHKHTTMSYQDLCKSLCARFDLAHLAKLRSLLFYTACLDPAFPATLFKDKMRCAVEDHQSKKLMVAADIVTMFNLIQMNGGLAKDKLPVAHRGKFHKNQSLDSSRSDNTDAYKFQDYDQPPADGHHPHHPHHPHHHHHHHNHHHLHHQHQHQLHPVPQNASPCGKPDRNGCQQFVPSSHPNFLLGVNKDLRCRAASMDKLQHLPQYSSGGSRPPSPPCDMQTTYFPMDVDSESTTDQDSLQHMGHPEPFSVHSCVQKRNIFKEDFHNFVAFSPQVLPADSKQGNKASDGYHHRRELHKPATFFNHSFELPYSNPYNEPMLNSPIQERRRAKHESLDDLQASTYFGPTTVSECVSAHRQLSKPGKMPAWPVKSLSLNTDEGPPAFERTVLNCKPLKENQRHNISVICDTSEPHFQSPKQKATASPLAFPKKTNGVKTKEAVSMACGPVIVDKREAGKRFREKIVHSSSFQDSSSVGTQTEQQAAQKKAKEYASKYCERERRPFKPSSEDEPQTLSDDISDIFRFLDEMSVCDSLGVIQSPCYNSNGSLSQVTLKSDGDSSPERNTVRLAKSKLDRLFQSMESADDELKSSVCKLVSRIGEIEKKLESLSGVRGEISQVLSKLNRLDEKIQEPEGNGRHGETQGQGSGLTAGAAVDAATKTGSVSKSPDHGHAHIDPGLSPHVFQCHTTGHNVKKGDTGGPVEWCCPEGGNSESMRVRALKKNMFTRRSSRSLNEENGATESKLASIANSPRDWRTMVRPKPPKDPYLVEQVFAPHPFSPGVKAHVKGSPLYADLQLVGPPDGKRGHPSWTLEEFKRNSGEKGKHLTALDLQTQESLNPNNLEYWMEDIYTPGYDSLLKRKEAEFRRAKACKIGALIAAATCTVILVIVVPICTMKT